MNELPFETLKKVKDNLIDLKLQRPSSSATVEAIPRDFGFSESYFSSSLVTLWLSNNNLSCVDFPIDWSCLTLLKVLVLDGNPIVSMPNCVRTLPNLEALYMNRCDMLTSIEHPPPTLRLLGYTHSDSKTNLLRKMSFHPEMCPLKLSMNFYSLATSFIEIEGVVKIQPMAGVEEAVLRNLEWSNLEFTKTRHIGTYNRYTGKSEGSQTQIPSWIRNVKKEESISLIIPSSPKQLRVKEMEPGDHVTITTTYLVQADGQHTKECGVSFVYNDGSIEDEEEDVLGYYKSWNHIIGGDLFPFQLTSGGYVLCIWGFGRVSRQHLLVKERTAFFRAFSQKKSNKRVRAIEDVTK